MELKFGTRVYICVTDVCVRIEINIYIDPLDVFQIRCASLRNFSLAIIFSHLVTKDPYAPFCACHIQAYFAFAADASCSIFWLFCCFVPFRPSSLDRRLGEDVSAYWLNIAF